MAQSRKQTINIAIIPARAGSKGLKSKNIRMLVGKPLIRWTIDEALKVKFFDKIIITTDILFIILTSPKMVDFLSGQSKKEFSLCYVFKLPYVRVQR